ncbi:MAG: formate acetyltransferase [Desulfobacterales bacterium]|nr:formate acetyltransferase [Desulfobacterales bacterium]
MKSTLAMLVTRPAPSRTGSVKEKSKIVSAMDGVVMNSVSFVLLKTFTFLFNRRPSLNRYLKGMDGWINFTIGFRTASGNIKYALQFENGRVSLLSSIPASSGTVLYFKDEAALRDMLKASPSETLVMIIENTIRVEGNMTYMSLFSFYMALLVGKKHKKLMAAEIASDRENAARLAGLVTSGTDWEAPAKTRMSADPVPEACFLKDPCLSAYTLADFPRLKQFKDIFFNTRFQLCTERPVLLTDWYREHGFEHEKNGQPWNPVRRQGMAFKHLMENKQPLIRKGDLLGGTTTTKEIGVVIYPDARNSVLWGELKSLGDRMQNPYDLTEEEIEILHNNVFPFWIKRNFTEWVRDKHDNPVYQQLDDRLAVYFAWKTVALSHTVVDFPKMLKLGIRGIIREIDTKIGKNTEPGRHELLLAMKSCLQGIVTYAANLSARAQKEAEAETDPRRKNELQRIAANCARVPEHPARSLDEALQSIWIGWIAVHMENTNAGFSLGRMDQWLQPYFENDIKDLETEAEKTAYIEQVIEWVGCFCMRCTDHLPAVPDFGNQLFGGSSSNQVITLGGVTPEGGNAVNDMTYIFLKVTELLKFKDPNMNARYTPGVNSDTYLNRICEVNLLTGATPAIHNDHAMITSLTPHGYRKEEMRDWVAIGCVEPTIPGKHIGHTNCMMFNMVAAMEMVLYNGYHPLMDWKAGPETGDIDAGGFPTFEAFFNGFTAQLQFLIDNSVAYNNALGEAHAVLRPTPYLSALIQGCMDKGLDVTEGGALYNTSGVACIGLADITDSLMVVKKLVYDEKRISLRQLKEAVMTNFENDPAILAMVKKKAPKFGSGDSGAVEMANRVTAFIHTAFAAKKNYRGGIYTTGFWSMSNHVAFGRLSGALPSGRLAGKAFTPGLTPSPGASQNLLDNLRDVSLLKPENLDNNIAFNVKYVPGTRDSHEKTVSNIAFYVRTYMECGGMQMQLNVISAKTLRDAVLNPENYRDLMVRISGYNAYFTQLNRDMQIELIERSEFEGR